jgi:hypothetical protein
MQMALWWPHPKAFDMRCIELEAGWVQQQQQQLQQRQAEREQGEPVGRRKRMQRNWSGWDGISLQTKQQLLCESQASGVEERHGVQGQKE